MYITRILHKKNYIIIRYVSYLNINIDFNLKQNIFM